MIDALKVLYQDAQQALQQGKWALACAQLSSIWDKFPEFYPAGFQLGVAQMSSQLWQDAIVTYQRLFTEGHDAAEVCCNLAIAYWQQHALKQALIYFRYTLKHYPYHADTHHNLANLYLSYQHFKPAIKHYQCLVHLYPAVIDYRFKLAATLQKCHMFDEAIFHYREILQLTPIHVDSFYNLACIYWQLKDLNAAHHFCLRSLKLRFDPELDFMRKRIEQVDVSTQEYEQYVHALFENYASHYDLHMQKTLAYQAPTALHAYLKQLNKTFEQVIDLACGTGLAGKYLRPYSTHLMGIDISAAMLEKARQTKQYDRLLTQDALPFLNETQTVFDLIIALEFIPYVPSLPCLFTAIHQRLSDEGHCIMTVEIGETGMGEHGRMQFSEAFIHQCLNNAGLKLLHQQQLQARRHEGDWLDMLYLDVQKGSTN